jgi:hypothetical protein
VAAHVVVQKAGKMFGVALQDPYILAYSKILNQDVRFSDISKTMIKSMENDIINVNISCCASLLSLHHDGRQGLIFKPYNKRIKIE